MTSAQGGRIAENQPTPWAGAEERVNIYATMLWVAVLAIGLLRAHGTDPEGNSPGRTRPGDDRGETARSHQREFGAVLNNE